MQYLAWVGNETLDMDQPPSPTADHGVEQQVSVDPHLVAYNKKSWEVAPLLLHICASTFIFRIFHITLLLGSGWLPAVI